MFPLKPLLQKPIAFQASKGICTVPNFPPAQSSQRGGLGLSTELSPSFPARHLTCAGRNARLERMHAGFPVEDRCGSFTGCVGVACTDVRTGCSIWPSVAFSRFHGGSFKEARGKNDTMNQESYRFTSIPRVCTNT